jgi:hypothetical protein
MTCISCNYEHEEKYCPNCGEKKDTKKITLVTIFEDTLSSVTNMDKGFLYNTKSLLLKPQKITDDYIRGKRKGILNPVSFLILSVTIYLIVINVIRAPKEPSSASSNLDSEVYERTFNAVYEVGKFIREYIKYFWILSIVPLALSLKLVFKKYNYLEHLTLSSFIVGQATLISVISYLLFKTPLIFDPVVYIMIFWLIFKIFKSNNALIEPLLLSITTLILFIIQLVIIVSIIGIIRA